MGNHNDCIAASMDVAEFFHDDMTAAAVEIASRFVGEDDGRVSNEATCYSNALLLAARELAGHIVFAFAEMEVGKDVIGLFEAADFVMA